MAIPSFQAQLFGAGLPTAGTPVRAELRSRALVLHTESGAEEEIDYSFLRGGAGGWDGRSLLLEWDGERGARSLAVNRADALAIVRSSAPPAFRAKLGALPRPRRAPRRVLAIAVVASLVAAIIVVLALAAGTGRLVDAAVRRVPPSWEAKLGAATVAPYTLSGKLVEEGPAVDAVEEIGKRLTAQVTSPYTFQWYVVRDATVNAMAAPGGSVIVFTGLLEQADNGEEVAGVLAHEMQHVLLQHSLRGIVRDLGTRTLVSLVFGGDWGGLVGGAAEKLGGLRFSRRQESEADEAAVGLLEKAQIDPAGMTTFFEKLASEGGEPPAFLSTHPASRERAARIRELAKKAPAVPPLDLDWEGVRRALAAPEPAKE